MYYYQSVYDQLCYTLDGKRVDSLRVMISMRFHAFPGVFPKKEIGCVRWRSWKMYGILTASGARWASSDTIEKESLTTSNNCNTVVASKFFLINGPDGKQVSLSEWDYFRRLNLIYSKCNQALRRSFTTACSALYSTRLYISFADFSRQKKYPVKHFTSSVCPTVFGPQDSYYEHENDVCCHYHYSTRVAMKCAGCDSAIFK